MVFGIASPLAFIVQTDGILVYLTEKEFNERNGKYAMGRTLQSEAAIEKFNRLQFDPDKPFGRHHAAFQTDTYPHDLNVDGLALILLLSSLRLQDARASLRSHVVGLFQHDTDVAEAFDWLTEVYVPLRDGKLPSEDRPVARARVERELARHESFRQLFAEVRWDGKF